MKKELELYLHIPFCVRKCAYCDFLSAPADDKTRQEYVDTLIQEIKSYREEFREYRVSTVFVGGGTPSILTCRQIREIFRNLKDNFEIDEKAEITIEVNPGTVTEEKLSAWKQAGINRISIGLQSVNDIELKMLGRIHDYQQFLETYRLIRESGFHNVNVDLISAIPGQTLESWSQTLRTVAELNPEHISAYSLIIEEGTPFYELYGEKGEQKSGGDMYEYTQFSGMDHTASLPALPDEETDRAIYEATENILKEYGYARYEISNYAKEGYACKHNIGYWKRTEYLGIGLGASSLIQKQRFHNTEDYQKYLEKVRKKETIRMDQETLSQENEMEEFMFLGLRMMNGIQMSRFRQLFGKEIWEIYETPLCRMEKAGLLEIQGDAVRLTKRGIDISNYIFEQFLLTV